MGRRQILLAGCMLSAVLIIGAAWGAYRERRDSFVVGAREDADSLRQQVREIHSLLGIERWEFDFRLPPQHTLYATFQAEFNGEPVPFNEPAPSALSGTYHVVPAMSSVQTNGKIQIEFYHPRFESKVPQDARWTLTFRAHNEWDNLITSKGRGVGNSFSFVSPFDPSASEFIGPAQGRSTRSARSFKPGREYEIWSYTASSPGAFDGSEEPYDFKYTLTVRMERRNADDVQGGVFRVDSPE
jgi:hypothetical protein